MRAATADFPTHKRTRPCASPKVFVPARDSAGRDGAKFPVGRIADAFLQSAHDQAIFLAQRRGLFDADEDHVASRRF